jgi:hypothetical protein
MMDLTGGVSLSGGLHPSGKVRERVTVSRERWAEPVFLVLGQTGFALVRNFFSLFFSFFLSFILF